MQWPCRDKIYGLEAVLEDMQKRLKEAEKREKKEDMMFYILERLPMPEILAQLAEECAELGKAALKLRRVIDGRNPTPVTILEASENIAEEIADVLLCLEVIGFDHDGLNDFRMIMDAKRKRWVDRLQEVERKCDNAD